MNEDKKHIAPKLKITLAHQNTLGQVTGTKVKILGTNDFIYTVTYYDDKGRAIQTQSTQYGGGVSITTTQFDFSGKALVSFLKQARDNQPEMYITTVITYDEGAG